MLALARARLTERGLGGHCAVRQADMYRLPLPDAGFDVVALQMVLHYAEDPAAALAEAARVLRPGRAAAGGGPRRRMSAANCWNTTRIAGPASTMPAWPAGSVPPAAPGCRRRRSAARSRFACGRRGECRAPSPPCLRLPSDILRKASLMSRPPLLEALRNRVLLCDGGMGSRVQALTLDIDKDYWGKENCTDVLNLSRPDLVREIHRGYYEAGADMVLTNSFGGSPVTLAEFEIGDRAFDICKASGELAREAAETFADGRDRWVIGDIGPGTKLPSLGHIGYDALQAALEVQCLGLIAGGVDAILTETNQDTLFIKAAVNAAKAALKQPGRTSRSSCRSRSRPPGRCWSGRTSPPPPPSCIRSTCR